jgi:protein gp37
MNKQGKNGIEWLNTTRADGSTRFGYSWNPIAGCQHQCRWTMPDGTTAICYAELVAERVAQGSYKHGFAHHYYHPERLREPMTVKESAHIFLDSMADLFGRWVPAEQIQAVLDAVCEAEQHIFISLTKNAPRLKEFCYPQNMWLGVSSPPDQILGHTLTRLQQEKMLRRALETLSTFPSRITWMSFEPLSWDVASIVAEYPKSLRWSVIGAASNGPRMYQPDPAHVSNLLTVLEAQNVRTFFKGNLKGNPAAIPWREEYPEAIQ